MSLINMKVFFSITLLAKAIDVSSSLKCVVETSCSCQLHDGSLYDLNKLSEQSPLKSDPNNSSYTFSFQPCKNIKIDMIPNDVTECNNSTGVSLCAQLGKDKPFSLGNTTETKWNILENGPQLELNHASHTTRIKLICCDGCKLPQLIFNRTLEKDNYELTLNSMYACPVHKAHEGISTGSRLVILFFVFSAVYFVVGALALRFFRGAIGWEMIPNYDFWSSVPGLFRIFYSNIEFFGINLTLYVAITLLPMNRIGISKLLIQDKKNYQLYTITISSFTILLNHFFFNFGLIEIKHWMVSFIPSAAVRLIAMIEYNISSTQPYKGLRKNQQENGLLKDRH